MDAARLKPHCILVRGSANAAIYNLKDGCVYSLNAKAAKKLEQPLKNPRGRHNRAFFEKLESLGLLEESASPLPAAPLETPPAPALEFMWLELTSRCNLRCLHCYGDCLAGAPDEPELTGPEWDRILEQGAGLGCRSVQFIGGEPLLCKDLGRRIATARDRGFEFVEVFSNLTRLTPGTAEFFREHGVHAATTLYSVRPEVHDRITQIPGSQARTLAAMSLLRERGVPVRVAIIAMLQNQQDLEETVAFLQDGGFDYKMPDPVRPTGRGCSRDVIPDNLPEAYEGEMKEPDFRTDRESFVRNHAWNPCWAGKIAITSTGEVLPCIFARDRVAGSVRKRALEEIVRGPELLGLWKITKDQVEGCRDCEYRYACHDCRPLATGHGGDLKARSPRCRYNPYRGRWETPSSSGKGRNLSRRKRHGEP